MKHLFYIVKIDKYELELLKYIVELLLQQFALFTYVIASKQTMQ